MNDDFPWDYLLEYIEDGKVVPVLGQELIEADYQGRRVSLERILAERLAEREKLSVEWNPHFELNDAVGAYLEKQSKLAGIYDRVGSLLRGLSPPFPIPAPLLKLADIRPLGLFVSLTFDSLMARALDQVRFGGQPVTREIEFSLNQSTAAQTEALLPRSSAAPVVFNLFGRAGGKSDFAIHDEDQLEFIHRFVSGDVAPPEWLLSELRNSHLLVLGAHLPDWLGRFILRAATRDRLRSAQRAYFLAGENAPSAATLAEFLRRFGRETEINVYAGTAEAFVTELHARWMERNPEALRAQSGPPGEEAAQGSIFISYGRENLGEVERLHAAIKGLGGDAWFDKVELAPGDYWERKILPQIQREVRLFVPVISDRTASRLRTSEGYVFQEWDEALKRKKRMPGRRFILPVVIDPDYAGDLRRYQGLVDAFPDLQDLHFGRAPGGEPDDALRKALVEEIRAMRREEAR